MFYELSHKVDAPKEVGVGYPQAHCLTQKEAAHRLRHATFPDFLPELQFELNKRARLTDVLSEVAIMAHGVLISRRLREWLASFNLGKHAFYPTQVFARDGQEHSYFYLHVLPLPIEALDFERSTFVLLDITTPIAELHISSYDDYLTQKKEHGILKPIKLSRVTLSRAFDAALDLFVTPIADGRLLISERFRENFFNENFTGADCSQVTNVSVSVPTR